ncbi:MAG: superoxide dismutase family protein [Acidimicrobiia bacterium]
MQHKMIIAVAAAATVSVGVVVASSANAHDRSTKAWLATADGTRIGAVSFTPAGRSTEVKVRLSGVPGLDAFHGFHIHANDVPSNGEGCIADPAAASSTWFVSADGHFNPTTANHGHHVGDMPVVYVNSDGSVETRFRIDRIETGVLRGKVVILHAGADNFANIPLGSGATQYTANSADAIAATARTGNAGDRVACGVIGER